MRQLALYAGRSEARTVIWRQGSKAGKHNPRAAMRSRFLALRVCPANRTIRRAADGSLPECWLLAEWPPAPPGRPVPGADGALQAADEGGAPVWTLDALAEAARAEGIEVRRSQVRRILLAEGVRWRRARSWARSRDPDFAGKGRGSSRSTPARPRA